MFSYIKTKIEYQNERYKIVKAYIPHIAKNEMYIIYHKELNELTSLNAISGFYKLEDAIKIADYLVKLNLEKENFIRGKDYD